MNRVNRRTASQVQASTYGSTAADFSKKQKPTVKRAPMGSTQIDYRSSATISAPQVLPSGRQVIFSHSVRIKCRHSNCAHDEPCFASTNRKDSRHPGRLGGTGWGCPQLGRRGPTAALWGQRAARSGGSHLHRKDANSCSFQGSRSSKSPGGKGDLRSSPTNPRWSSKLAGRQPSSSITVE